MRNARLDESQARIKIGRRNINNLRYVDDSTIMAESEEELKSLSMRVKQESERAGLRLNIKKKKKNKNLRSWTSSPIAAWQIEGGKVEIVEQISSSWDPESLRMVTAAIKSENDCFLAGKQWQT